MTNVSQAQAATALQLLADAAVDRRNELRQYDDDSDPFDSDENVDSDAPIFDRFYQQGGSAAILEMKNFDPTQFLGIWSGFQGVISQSYNAGRGRKSIHSGKDVLFMTLCVVKHGGQWDFLAKMFGLKGPSFGKLIMKFVDLLWLPVYEQYVENQGTKWTMMALSDVGRLFRHFSVAPYASDVTFQPSYRLSGSIQEGKRYYSGKHKQYGYKMEVSVLPNGMAIGGSEHGPRSVSDLILFQRMQYFHDKQLQKKGEEKGWDDDGPDMGKYPESWAVLVDKGYQGALEFCCVVHPTKKRRHAVMPPTDVKRNILISRDRIIVENVFGRLCGIWNVLGSKWKWNEKSYDPIFKLYLGLTNFHIRWKPLREEDGQVDGQIRTRWFRLAENQARRRKLGQEKYREKRRRRMDIQFRVCGVPDRDPDGISVVFNFNVRLIVHNVLRIITASCNCACQFQVNRRIPDGAGGASVKFLDN